MTPPTRPPQEVTDDALITALVAGKTVTEAAAFAGCSSRTAYRRMLDSLFAARLTEARAQRLQPHVIRLDATTGDAIEQLRALAFDPAVHPSTRVRACAYLIELALKLREHLYLAPRVAALEAALADAGRESPSLPVAGETQQVA
jgi:hypothetical protein